MAYESSTTGNSFRVESVPVTTVPYTMAAFGKNSSLAVNVKLVSEERSGGGYYIMLFLAGDFNDKVTLFTNPSFFGLGATANYSTTNWNHAVGLASSTTSRTVYYDGGNSASTSHPHTVEELQFTNMLALEGATTGAVAEVAMWNAALNADEVLSLSKGFKPSRVRPQSLVYYAPLIRNVQDIRAARAITDNNIATVAAHPRVY